MILLVLATFIGLSVLILYCYFGKLAADSYDQMCDCVYNSNWQKLSLNLQKYIIIIIANMQKSLYYHGFGIVTLDLNTFIRVRYSQKQINDSFENLHENNLSISLQLCRSVISYYLAFKELNQSV